MRRWRTTSSFVLPLMLASGCHAVAPRDAAVLPPPQSAAAPAPVERPAEFHTSPPSQTVSAILAAGATAEDTSRIRTAQLERSDEPSPPTAPPKLPERLSLPPGLPGADVPGWEGAENPAQEPHRLLPPLPEVNPPAAPRLSEQATLEELESLTLSLNPQLIQAATQIQTNRGQAIQAGLKPNPVVGYEADTVNSAGTANYQGVYLTQVIKTAGKLDLARAAANVEVANAQLNLRQTRITVLTKVRAAYFAVLVARENVKANEALARLTDEAYELQLQRLKAGEVAAYEPVQLRALAFQARAALTQARNRAAAAWRQLAAAVGMPDLPPRELVGAADMPMPVIQYESAVNLMLLNHANLQTARNQEQRARILLRLAELTPVPDVFVYGTVQRDFTTSPTLRTTWNLQLGLPIPIYDRNQGGILSAQADLVRASQEAARVRNDLLTQLAQAYERYANSQVLVETYRTEILPAQAQVYRSVYERHQLEPDVVDLDIVVLAQQTLLNSITTYIQALGAQWTAVTDIAQLVQADSLQELTASSSPPEAALPPPAEAEPKPNQE